jgi:ATP-dependent Clp protease protease subunit
MSEDQAKQKEGYFTLSGDVNSDMVHRVFEAVADMNNDGLETAHILLQSNGGYVSDGLCLYNFLANAPVNCVMYNGGAVASIAVILFLAGKQRYASETARFMIHKSHATASPGSRPDALNIIVEGLRADDARTESILRKHIELTPEQWGIHQYGDLHLNARDAKASGMIDDVVDFAPELFRTVRIRNPLKTKQLHKGLQQLGEEGAVQVFKPVLGSDLILGAVGVLQFEVVASRLLNEYGVDAVFEGASISSARWVSSDDKKALSDFETQLAHNVAYDAAGNMAYLATSGVNLRLTQERWPKLQFHATREHAAKLD